MNELIATKNMQVGETAIQTTSARDLHAFLGSGRMFSHWIKFRIKQYGFSEGEDFTVVKSEEGPTFGRDVGDGTDPVNKKGKPQNTGTAAIEYYISMDMAKELSMIENNAKGREARKYFIAAEKEMKRLQIENERIYAENQALIQSQLTNCHGAIDMLQTDNGVERAKINLPLRAEISRQSTLELQNARLDKEITLTQMRERFQESEAARILANAESEKERVEALIASEKARADAGSADGRRWKVHSKRLEERLSTLEGVCGIDRDFDLNEIKRLKLVKTYYNS